MSRPNRFIAAVRRKDGSEEKVHVKNTGRCRELLVPGCTVILAKAENPSRSTKYDLVAVYKERDGKSPLLINMDSQIPNDAAEEWLKKGLLFGKNAKIRREVTKEDSRFDFAVGIGENGETAFLEVKGCTLEKDGGTYFPDAPTERGVKHLEGLRRIAESGGKACLLFVIQMEEAQFLSPNDTTHPAFGRALREASAAGVEILACKCRVTEDSVEIGESVPVIL